MKMEKKKQEPLLIDVLYKQLNQSGNFERVSKGSFDDGSASWIECYHTISPNKKGKRWVKQLAFNGEGTILKDVQVWQDEMTWSDDLQKELR